MSNKIVITVIVIIVLGVGGWFLYDSGMLPSSEGPGATTTPQGQQQKEEEQQQELSKELSEILGKVKDVPGYNYKLEVTSPSQPQMGENPEMWVEGDKMRIEMSTQGQSVIYLMDTKEKVAYVYVPSQNMAVKRSLTGTQGEEMMSASPSKQSEKLLDYDAEITGTETIDEKECLVVEFTTENGEGTAWVWKKHGLPIKMKSRGGQSTSTTLMTDIEIGDIPNDKFELPEGVEVVDQQEAGQ